MHEAEAEKDHAHDVIGVIQEGIRLQDIRYVPLLFDTSGR